MDALTVTVSEAERAELYRILEHSLREVRVEVHHTHSPDFREGVQREESLLRGLLAKFKGAS